MSEVLLTGLQAAARACLVRYDLPPNCDVRLINLSENATYCVSSPDGGRWALRLHREGYHTRQAIASELAWLADLRAQKILRASYPIAGVDGAFIQYAEHSNSVIKRNAVLFEWEEGHEPLITENLNASFQTLGEVTARLHCHAKNWQRPSWFQRQTWDFDTMLGDASPIWGSWREGIGVTPEIETVFARTVANIRDRLLRYGKSSQRFGLIHADTRLANLLVHGNEVKVIDFDDCGFGWFMYDAATTVSFHEHEAHVPELINAWMQGYRRIAPLAKDDEAEIPTFLMLRRLLLVAWLGSRREIELSKTLGAGYTEASVVLCERFLSR
jgi:Ser/Thr protein kinase RdoA (MazF antagonist)